MCVCVIQIMHILNLMVFCSSHETLWMVHFPVGVDRFGVRFQGLVAPRAQWNIAENAKYVENIQDCFFYIPYLLSMMEDARLESKEFLLLRVGKWFSIPLEGFV